MALKIYDADQVTFSFANQPIDSGFADGEFIRVEQETDAFTDKVGTDGEVSRSKTNDNRATVTLLLMSTSSGNALLSALHRADKLAPNGAGVGVLAIKDLQGSTLHLAPRAWITKMPDASYDRESTTREWVFRTDNMDSNIAGN